MNNAKEVYDLTNEHNDQATKAEVQTTKLNKMPVAGENNAEFASEFTSETENANENHANQNHANQNQANMAQANGQQSQEQ